MNKENQMSERLRGLMASRDVACSECTAEQLLLARAADEICLSVTKPSSSIQLLAALEANERMFGQYPKEMAQVTRRAEAELNQFGVQSYLAGNWLGAEYAWRMLALAGSEDGKLKLSALIRRGEYYRRGKYGDSYAMELLRSGVEREMPVFLVNAALLQVQCIGGEEGWENARHLVEKLDYADVGVISRFWQQRAQAGDPEGELVHFMLVRWRKLKYSPVARWKELCETVHAVIPRVPHHLLVGRNYTGKQTISVRGKERDILFFLHENGRHYVLYADGTTDENGVAVVGCRRYIPARGCGVALRDKVRLRCIRTEEEWDLLEYWLDVAEEVQREPLPDRENESNGKGC